MDAAALRARLAEFLGDETFRKFVVGLGRAGRLRYWHERAWDRFTAAHPEYAIPPVDLLAALRVCGLHGAELIPDEIPVVEGNIDYDPQYHRARREAFPNAAVGPRSTEGGPSLGPTVGVWYCPRCREAEARWREARGRTSAPSDLNLISRTTLDEYGANWGPTCSPGTDGTGGRRCGQRWERS